MNFAAPISILVDSSGCQTQRASVVDSPELKWSKLVRAIKEGSDSAIEELYWTFGRGLKLLFCRQLGQQDCEDHVHEVFMVVMAAIQSGELRNPECLPGFIHTVARRRIAQAINELVRKRKTEVAIDDGPSISCSSPDPEDHAVDQESIRIMRAVLDELHPRDREILRRFYLLGESRESICQEMNLTETQFRLLKSRAKSRFASYGRRKLAQRQNGLQSLRLICSA